MRTKIGTYMIVVLTWLIVLMMGPMAYGAGMPAALSNLETLAVELVNADRQANGNLPALKINLALAEVARAHARDMMQRNFFSHINPDGLSPFDRMQRAGINWMYGGENIASGYGRNYSVEVAEKEWMKSPGHRANILNPNYTEIGIGIVADGSGQLYLVQCFLTPALGPVSPTQQVTQPAGTMQGKWLKVFEESGNELYNDEAGSYFTADNLIFRYKMVLQINPGKKVIVIARGEVPLAEKFDTSDKNKTPLLGKNFRYTEVDVYDEDNKFIKSDTKSGEWKEIGDNFMHFEFEAAAKSALANLRK